MNIVSLFSGGGGLDLGFKNQDFLFYGRMNMIKISGQLMKKTFPIHNYVKNQ